MTVTPVSGAEVQQWTDTGLEDMSMSDAVMPRIRIVGKEGMWSDNLTDTKIPNLYFISLGLVKQRVLFHPNVEEGDAPMCKSSDFNTGYPNAEPKNDKSFPWQLSGFSTTDYPADPTGQHGPLPCNGCALKDWDSHPVNKTPYCAEQWTMPIYYDSSLQPGVLDPNVAWEIEKAEWVPAIMTLQKSSLKPIKSYLSSFKASNKPPFLNVCKGTLKVLQRGDVLYSIPAFTKGPESPRERWNEFAVQFGEMRTFLIRPPIRDDEEPDGVTVATDNAWGGQAEAPAQPVVAQPAPAQPQTAPVQPTQPVAAQPQPVAPQPVAAQPQPVTPQPQPVAPQPQSVVQPTQPVAAQPQPVQPAAQPQPVAPQPVAAQPEPAAAPVEQPTPAPAQPSGQALPF